MMKRRLMDMLRRMIMAEQTFEADVIVIGFGGAGACAAIEAADHGAEVVIIEKQTKQRHYPNTRMSVGGFHSPYPEGDKQALREYAKALFSGENLPLVLEGEQPEISSELAEIWAEYAPKNEKFMKSLDPNYTTYKSIRRAFPDFPGSEASKYAVANGYYEQDGKKVLEGGEAFFACLSKGVQSRNIPVHYETRAKELLVGPSGEIIGVKATRGEQAVTYKARRGVIIASGGFEYNKTMRRAFLEGPAVEGWAFYGSTENTGDGIEMALKVGAAMSKVGNAAARVITAIPVRKNGLKIGLDTSAIGKPHELVVDNYGRRYADERRITKDPSNYIFYKEALHFNTWDLSYPRIPSWMIFDEQLRRNVPVVNTKVAAMNGIEWDETNEKAINNGWILKGETILELAEKIQAHPDNKGLMDPQTLLATVTRFNEYCQMGNDLEYARDVSTLGPVIQPPFYAIPLYVGGPNTKGGLKTNAKKQVLDWSYQPIPRLYAVGEIASVFQFAYQGGGNLAECIVFGRIAGKNCASEKPL